MAKMKAALLVEPGRIVLGDKPIPHVGPLDALMRMTTRKCSARRRFPERHRAGGWSPTWIGDPAAILSIDHDCATFSYQGRTTCR